MFKDYFTTEEIVNLQKDVFQILRENKRVFNFIFKLWKSNFRQFGFEQLVDEMFRVIAEKNNSNKEEEIGKINFALNDSEFKRFGRKNRRHGVKMEWNYALIKEFLSSNSTDHTVITGKETKSTKANNVPQTFLDFGCGKMALLRRIAREHKDIRKLYGYDPNSNPEYTDFDPRARFISKKEDLRKLEDIDLVYSSFVFHHLTEAEIKESFALIKSVLKPGGIFIFIEESFPLYPEFNLKLSYEKLQTLNYKPNEEVNSIFDALPIQEKFLALYINDVLINLKNLDYMPWTFEYRTIEEWRSTVEHLEFIVEEDYYFGVVKNNRLKQGITSMFVLRKKRRPEGLN